MMSVYNPQDWTRDSATNESYARRSRIPLLSSAGELDGITGMESVMPSPPPPYLSSSLLASNSVVHSRQLPAIQLFTNAQRTSPIFPRPGCDSPIFPQTSIMPTGSISNTPNQQISPTLFPPPPTSQRDRSGSRARGVLNNLSAWASRNKGADTSFTNIESNILQSTTVELSARASFMAALPTRSGHPVSARLATRRAASVGNSGVVESRESTRVRDPAVETNPWEPGMPLPPPPPGPPPGGRSQSLGRPRNASGPLNGNPSTPPRQLRRSTTLGSIPPTPVGWTEENDIQHYVTNAADPDTSERETEGLATRVYNRDGSPKSIRDRRNKSRARSRHDPKSDEHNQCQAISAIQEVAKPADLLLATNDNLMVRRSRMPKPFGGAAVNQISTFNCGNNRIEIPAFDTEVMSISKPSYHLPLTASVLTPPFSPENNRRTILSHDQPHAATSVQTSSDDPSDQLLHGSLCRYRSCLAREQAEVDHSKRLMLFTQFMVEEFTIRSASHPEAFTSNKAKLRERVESIWNLPDERSHASPEIPVASLFAQIRRSPLPLIDTNNFINEKIEPVLSPVLSTACGKTCAEDFDARGRPSSRWWETSTRSDTVDDIEGRDSERSRRESKYMGVTRENGFEPPSRAPKSAVHMGGPGYQMPLPSTTYTTVDVEKLSWRKQQVSPSAMDVGPELLSTPRPCKVDISRLVSLPPPYPRRYPALKNNHPALTSYRNVLCMLRDRSTPDNYSCFSESGYQNGDATNNSAALCDQLSTRIFEATTHLTQLCSDLALAVVNHNRTLTQEEGDDEPELLEKLTVAKRLFEIRERLYKEQVSLLGTLTTHNTKQTSLHHPTSPTLHHRLHHAKLAAKRHRDFQQTVQAIISRGIEDQLSAFWDIAPALTEVVRKVPTALRNFHIEIPSHEHAENPSYTQSPLQYFLSLLVHAEKSTYQFIDAQVNLFCLLHEVKTAVTTSRCKVVEMQWRLEGRGVEAIEEGVDGMRADADGTMTRELQGQVAVVEEQWMKALGDELGECRRKVEEYLKSSGGWVDGLWAY